MMEEEEEENEQQVGTHSDENMKKRWTVKKREKNRERTYIHPYRDRKKKNCTAANQSE